MMKIIELEGLNWGPGQKCHTQGHRDAAVHVEGGR